MASPIETVTERDLTRLADRAFSIAAGQGTARVVLGHPRNMDGSRGESARRAEEFAALLTERGLEVILWDERMTTLSAIGFLNQTNTPVSYTHLDVYKRQRLRRSFPGSTA